MSLKIFLIVTLTIRAVTADEYATDLENILPIYLKMMPYIRLELREGVSTDFENGYVEFFLRQTHCPILLSTYSLSVAINLPDLPESFVIVSDMKHLTDAVDYFSKESGIFFYIITDDVVPDDVSRIFRQLWYSRGIYKTLFLTVDDILYYDPFAIDDVTHTYGQVLPLNGRDLLHVFDDMNGYPLRVQIFKSVYSQPVYDEVTKKVIRFERIDAVVADALEEVMNYTRVYQEPAKEYFGERYPNGSYNGAIGMIMRGETDISLSGFFVKDYLVPEMEFTVAVYDDQLCCYVHKAPRIPMAIMPIVALSWDFWFGFVVSAFVCGTVWVVIRRINLWIATDKLEKLGISKHLRYQLIRIYIDTWVVWVRVNILKYPPFTSERIFILSLCLVSVISGAIIESSLATVYIHPMYYKDINTLQDLDESGLKIVYKYTSFKDDMFFSETSPLFAALNKKLVHWEDLNADVMQEVADNGGIVGVTRYSSLMLESIHFLLSNRVHIVKECPKYYTIAYIMPKNSPFASRFNMVLLRFLNAGLINKWIRDMHNKANVEMIKNEEMEESEVFKILTLVDLQLAFYVIAVGSLVSGVSFGVEVYIMRRKKLQRTVAKLG